MQRANATRIGLFVVGGLAVIVAAIVTVFGTRLFANTERAVMQFNGSIYGLQVGAPVVFRGVRLGSVLSMGVVHDPATGRFTIPVVVELDRALIRNMRGVAGGAAAGSDAAELSLPALVQRGLRAQLSTQSLLTGQLYVDLDLRPVAGAQGTAAVPPRVVTVDGMVEIPTRSTALQTLQAQLEGVDVGQLVRDVAAAAAAMKQLVASPQLKQTLDELALAASALKRLGVALEARVGPLAEAAQGTLADTRRAASSAAVSVGAAAERLGGAAERIGAAAGRVDAMLTPGSPLLASVQSAADELARSATALRQATAEDAPVVQSVERAAQDVARASRAVRELAELLERQPETLIRGRPAAP